MARPRRGVEMGVLLLLGQVLNTGLEHLPPVTLMVVALQVKYYKALYCTLLTTLTYLSIFFLSNI